MIIWTKLHWSFQMSYIPTIYEQIVTDVLNDKLESYTKYCDLWSERGYSKKDFDSYIQDIKYAQSLTKKPDFNIIQACNEAKEYVKDRKNIVVFRLNEHEKNIVLEAEDQGRIKNGENITYLGYDRTVKGFDYMDVPQEIDAFVIFSGHPGSGAAAVKAWYNDYQKTNRPKKLVFLGLHDNQGNTNFSNNSLRFNVKSEVEMYIRFFKACGVPKKFIKECLVTPKDISTADNINLLKEIRNKFFDKNKDTNFAMFAYPAYQKRIASEFTYGFKKLSDEHCVAPTNFYIPDVPVSQNEKDRYLSYDNLDGIAQDIIIGNCLAHPYRVSSGGRFDSDLGDYPDKYKPLLPLSLVYSYPNVANELAGTDIKTASVMKIMRAMQHKVKGWEAPEKVDRSIKKCVVLLRKELLKEGLVSNDILSTRGKIPLKKFQRQISQNEIR